MSPWDRAAPLIQQAVDRQDTHGLEDVKAEVDAGRAQLWCGTESALITEIAVYPRRKICRVWMAAGNMTELVHEMLPNVEAWAVEKGCSGMEVIGRHGWVRVLNDYHQPHTILAKEIGP